MIGVNFDSNGEETMPTKSVRTTITFPADLLEAADRAVRSGEARSRNDLVVEALRAALAAAERRAIDAAFRAMSEDATYQQEAEQIDREFAVADWEALQKGEPGQ